MYVTTDVTHTPTSYLQHQEKHDAAAAAADADDDDARVSLSAIQVYRNRGTNEISVTHHMSGMRGAPDCPLPWS